MALKHILTALASLRLTVVLFVLAMVLIFAGTLAQRDTGNWDVVNAYFRSFAVLIPLRNLIFVNVPSVAPFPGGYLIGGVMLVNLLAAHTVRFKFNRKRIGILTIHAGIVLLLVSEMVTGLSADEAIMSIDEGSYANFTEDLREVELAIIDPSDPDQDAVVVIPESILRRAAGGEPIRHELLPFDVVIEEWMPNSQLLGPAMMRTNPEFEQNNPATHGIGRTLAAQPVPPITGVEEQRVNLPAAYLTLQRDGETLGTYLASAHFLQRQPIELDGNRYEIVLRFKRDYKPYTMHLIDFTHDKFIGTEKPRNFSSLIRLVDPESATRTVECKDLHEPPAALRAVRRSTSQAFKKGDGSGTILQVVRNPGWLLPYVSCTLVCGRHCCCTSGCSC